MQVGTTLAYMNTVSLFPDNDAIFRRVARILRNPSYNSNTKVLFEYHFEKVKYSRQCHKLHTSSCTILQSSLWTNRYRLNGLRSFLTVIRWLMAGHRSLSAGGSSAALVKQKYSWRNACLLFKKFKKKIGPGINNFLQQANLAIQNPSSCAASFNNPNFNLGFNVCLQSPSVAGCTVLYKTCSSGFYIF